VRIFQQNAILKSILANIYWQYYQNNRWRFQQRTETVNFDNEDFQTWDLSRLIKEIVKYFNASLEQSDKLKKDFYKRIWRYSCLRVLLNIHISVQHCMICLQHQALAFFVNDEASVTQPVYKLNWKWRWFFFRWGFVDINYTTKDSLSLKFHAIQLYQQLIAFHLDDKEKDALIDVDLTRLNFVRSESVNSIKDSLYLNAVCWDGKAIQGTFLIHHLFSFNIAHTITTKEWSTILMVLIITNGN